MSDPILGALLANLDTILWDQLNVIADRLEDEGDSKRAEAYRWIASQKLHPLRYGNRWHWRRRSGPDLPLGHALPDAVISAMLHMVPRIGLDYNEADSMAKAYQRAVDAMVACDYLNPLSLLKLLKKIP